MQTERRVATNPQTKPTDLGCEYTILQPFNGLFSRTTWVSRYQKGKTNLDFTGARDSEWQWHQLRRMQVCTSLQTDGAAVLKERLPKEVRLNGTCSSGADDDRSISLQADQITMATVDVDGSCQFSADSQPSVL